MFVTFFLQQYQCLVNVPCLGCLDFRLTLAHEHCCGRQPETIFFPSLRRSFSAVQAFLQNFIPLCKIAICDCHCVQEFWEFPPPFYPAASTSPPWARPSTCNLALRPLSNLRSHLFLSSLFLLPSSALVCGLGSSRFGCAINGDVSSC